MRFKPTEIATIAVAGLALVGSVISAFYTYTNRNRELDIKLVEIGIGILRSDPKETGLTAARGWAVQVIEENSRVKFSNDDRQGLLQKPLLYQPAATATLRDAVEHLERQMKERTIALERILKEGALNDVQPPSK